MKIGFHRYQDIFQRVLKEEQVNTEELKGYDRKFEILSDSLKGKMTKTLECMAGTDGQLYTKGEVAIANNNYFRKCVTGFRA
jgi:hypothetical protein